MDMTDLEILDLINANIAEYAAEDMKKCERQIRALLYLKEQIMDKINASLNHQALRDLAQKQ